MLEHGTPKYNQCILFLFIGIFFTQIPSLALFHMFNYHNSVKVTALPKPKC